MIRSIVLAATVAFAGTASALEITNVSHSPAAIDPSKRQQVTVRFHLSEPAQVALRIFDGRDFLVREIATKKSLGVGDAHLVWDGRDAKGRVAPSEAYAYTLLATPAQGPPIEWDLTDLSGNEELAVSGARFDPRTHSVLYELASPARVSIRGGLNSGPLLRTIVDWVARAAGPHAEPWNGKDEAGLIDASNHPDVQVTAQAWSLPRNTIVVLPERPRVELISGLGESATRRSKRREEPFRERALHQQPIERRGDVKIRLSLPNETKRDRDGHLVASGRTAIELDVDPADRPRLLEQRFEVGFFIDGKYVFENEVGFLPMTFIWDAGAANAGVHFVTGNVWGYSGQFGTATIAVRAAPK